MILYIKDPKNYPKTPKCYKQLHQCGRIQNQLTKTVRFLYTNNEQIEKEYMKTIPFVIVSKKKYLGVNVKKDVKDLYKDKYKPQKKETEENYRR
jgi:hypothetical protein